MRDTARRTFLDGARSRRLLLGPAIVLLVVSTAGPATGTECPKLINRIYADAGTRFDEAAHEARKKAAEAARLHTEGKHREARQLAWEGCLLIGGNPPCPRR